MHAMACMQSHGAAGVMARQPFPFSDRAAERPHIGRDDAVLITDWRRIAADQGGEWWLPGSPRICVVMGDGSASVRIRNRDFAPLAKVSLIGPTAHAHRLSVEGATVVSFALTPIGWSRLFRESAASIRNLVVPLEQLAGPTLAADLAGLVAADPVSACRAMTRALFPPLLVRPHPDEALIRGIMDMVDDPATTQVREMVDRLGITDRRLLALALRHFGLPAKVLLRRARFLRSLASMDVTRGRSSYSSIDPSYHDASHFLRDADHFLGTTPRRFRALSARP